MVATVTVMLTRLRTSLLRRRSLLLKVVFLLGTAWLTVAFLLFTEQRPNYSDTEDNLIKAGMMGMGVRRGVLGVPQPQARIGNPPTQGKTNSRSHNAAGPEGGEGGVLVPPREHLGDGPLYGEMGKPVVLPANMTSDVKKLVDEGWQKNAFNQYVSDLISLHRKLPDPRDEW